MTTKKESSVVYKERAILIPSNVIERQVINKKDKYRRSIDVPEEHKGKHAFTFFGEDTKKEQQLKLYRLIRDLVEINEQKVRTNEKEK